MGEDTFANYDAARTNLLTAAILIAVSEGVGDAEHASQITARDARNIADLYLARFEANYAREGQAFAADAVVRSDVNFCVSVANYSRELIEAAEPQ